MKKDYAAIKSYQIKSYYDGEWNDDYAEWAKMLAGMYTGSKEDKAKVAWAQVNAIRSQNFSGRKDGGPVGAGQTYMVGERGPEIFVPNSTGTIIPNNQMGMSADTGMGSTTENMNVTFNINTLDASDFNELLETRQELIIGLINRGLAERGKRSLTA